MPIVGNGDIAGVLKDRPDVTFLASGLSNSQNVTYADLVREKRMIFTYGSSERNHIVYFSSLSIYYSDSNYAQYKREIENYIMTISSSYTIVRIGNITWGKNRRTLLNYLKDNPMAERRDEIRYLIDKEEFLHWIDKIRPHTKDIMNITGRMINVKTL